MRYKAKVLSRFPDAKPVVVARWPEGEVKYVQIWADPNQRPTIALDANECLYRSSATAAWRSAYYWCVRNPQQKAA